LSNTSGAWWEFVPAAVFKWGSPYFQHFATPKSPSFMLSFSSINTLSGLISLWMTPRLCIKSIASISWTKYLWTVASLSPFYSCNCLFKSPWEANCDSTKQCSLLFFGSNLEVKIWDSKSLSSIVHRYLCYEICSLISISFLKERWDLAKLSLDILTHVS
jgi:hypothetical protein